MKKRVLLVLAVVSVAGCVDTPDSVCKEFRNANNEHIDALMMVTNERQAKNMTIRVFQHMRDRYTALDKKWDIMETNWGRNPDAQAIKDFLESDGLHLYRAEYKLNCQRCTLELARIRNLLNQYMERSRQAAKEDGIDPDTVKAAELYPALNAIVNTKNVIDPLRGQLTKPKLEELMVRFNDRVEPAVLEVFKQKQKQFNGPDIVLAN